MSASATAVPINPDARRAYEAGLNVVPTARDGTKRPAIQWAEYQQRRATEAEFDRWFGRRPHFGFSVICGPVSAPPSLALELLEFDDWATWEAFNHSCHAIGLGEVLTRLIAGCSVATPGGGIHLPYLCPQSEVVSNAKLATRLGLDGTRQPLIESRGCGGLFIAPPSNGPTHPTGGTYRCVHGALTTMATIMADERRDLWALARSFDEVPKPPEREPRRTNGNGDLRPGDAFNAATDWADILPSGWTWVYRRGEVDYLRRPGKSRGISATINYAGSDLLYVFSSSTVFEPGRAYDRFGAYAVLRHGGDLAAATRALAAQGYGVPRAAARHVVTLSVPEIDYAS